MEEQKTNTSFNYFVSECVSSIEELADKIKFENGVIISIIIIIMIYYLFKLRHEKTADVKILFKRMLTFDVVILIAAIIILAFYTPGQLFSIFLTITGFYITYRLFWIQLKQEKENDENDRKKTLELLEGIQENFKVSALNRELILFQQRGIEDILVKEQLREFFGSNNLMVDRNLLMDYRYENLGVPSITTFIINSDRLEIDEKYTVLIRVSDHENNFSADANGLKITNYKAEIKKEIYGFMKFTFTFDETEDFELKFEMIDKAGNKSKQSIFLSQNEITANRCELLHFVGNSLPKKNSTEMMTK